MKQYQDFLRHIRDNGVCKGDRTGTGTLSTFGYQMRFDLKAGFPIVTTKMVHFKSVLLELLWMISGNTNVQWLQERGCTIWDEWANEQGDLGPVYGAQWRSWRAAGEPYTDSDALNVTFHIDQLQAAIDRLKTNPDCRRIIVSAWNPADLDKMALAPCHAFFQFYTAINADGKRELSCQLYQRSVDSFLGGPFNIASYALLTHMVAAVVGMEVGEFVWTGGDCHIYSDHIEQVKTQLSREPYPLPKLVLKHRDDIDDFVFDDFALEGYQHHAAIKAPVAV